MIPDKLSIENLVFSADGGKYNYLVVAGYDIKKVMKVAAIVIGLFVKVSHTFLTEDG